jgi:hypothetical protein
MFLVCCGYNCCRGQVCDLNSLDYGSISDYGPDPGCSSDLGYSGISGL